MAYSMTIFNLALTLYLLTAAYYEHRWRKVPNWLTFPVMAAALALGVHQRCLGRFPRECIEGTLGILAIWVWLYVGWLLRFYGAGDAKVLMSLFALFPTIQWLWVLCGSIVLVGGVALFVKYRGNVKQIGVFYLANLLTRQFHPTETEKEQGNFPLVFPTAMAGVIYAWFLA